MSDLLLERAAELAAIHRAIRVARAGCGRQVVVCGPPGSGRTALLEQACAAGAAHGLRVLSAAGEVSERAFPLALAQRLLEPEPWVQAERYEHFVELNRLLADRAPALVVIDDLQWSDAQSLEWLAFVARRLRRTGVAVIVAARDALLPDAIVLRPQPLSERAVAAFLHVELGHVTDTGFAAACHRATAGRPRLVHELAVAARRARAHETGEGEAWVATALPPGVSAYAERCLEALTPESRSLAAALVVLGRSASLHAASELAGVDTNAAVGACDALRDAGLLDGLTVTPPLLARAIYAAIPPARRASMHAEAARFGGAAYHLLRSEPSADPWVVSTLRHVAEQLLGRGRPVDAARLLRRAAREGVGHARADLLIELARAEGRLADGGEIQRLKAAIESGASRARVADPLARALLTHGRAEEALALADADPVELHAGARLQPGAGAEASARLAEATEGTPALLACRAAETVCAAESAETAIALATAALDDPRLDPEAPAFFLACAALAWSDRLSLARDHLERARRHAQRFGSVAGRVRSEVGLAGVALRAGDVEGAVLHATAALGAGRGTTLALPARAVLVLALVEFDRLEDAAAACDASTPELRFARGHLRLLRYDRRGALEDLLAVGRALAADAIEGPAVIPWRSAAALALPPDAEALAGEEHALALRFGAPRAIGRAQRVLAAVGPRSERTERCRAAVAVLERSEARLEHAYALCDLGANLRRDRARRDAREPLREALDLAVRCDAAALARRAREELVATGARPRRLAQSGRDALTPAELRVARLAARGLANREIAQTLVVTVKTVETELGHAYAKLGIRSRRDLPAALQTAT